MQIRPLEDLTKDELIALIQQERTQYEAVGAGGVALMGDAKDMIREDAIYLGCARMGLAEASDDEILNFVRIAKRRAALIQQEQV